MSAPLCDTATIWIQSNSVHFDLFAMLRILTLIFLLSLLGLSVSRLAAQGGVYHFSSKHPTPGGDILLMVQTKPSGEYYSADFYSEDPALLPKAVKMSGNDLDEPHPSQRLLGGKVKLLAKYDEQTELVLQSSCRLKIVIHHTASGLIEGATVLDVTPACGKIHGKYPTPGKYQFMIFYEDYD
jgi:hypothetical protein